MFLVFRTPPEGISINLEFEAELARVVVVPRQDGARPLPMDEAELQDLRRRHGAYLAEEKTTASRWTAAAGDSFTHLYKAWSRRNR